MKKDGFFQYQSASGTSHYHIRPRQRRFPPLPVADMGVANYLFSIYLCMSFNINKIGQMCIDQFQTI